MKNHFANVGHTEFFNIDSQYYGSNAPGIANSLTLGGTWIDHTVPPTDTSCASSPTVEDSSIQAEVAHAITMNGWTADTTSEFLVYTPPPDYENQGGGACSELQFCAYHGYTTTPGTLTTYAAMPYPINLVNCPTLQSGLNGNDAGDALASFSSHESTETVTDPFLTSYYDASGEEIGDKCAYLYFYGPTLLNSGKQFALQPEYSNSSHECQNWYNPDTGGVYRPSTGQFLLRNENSTGAPDIHFVFGAPNSQPVLGDWTNKGYESVGVYHNGVFSLRNTNSAGPADTTVVFGASGDIPVAGDWTGLGHDGIGVFRPSTGQWFLKNDLTAGPPDITFSFGTTGDIPVIGNWFDAPTDSFGIYRPSTNTFYLKYAPATGPADISFAYGKSGDQPLGGDPSSQGYYECATPPCPIAQQDTPGLWTPSTTTFQLTSNIDAPAPSYVYAFGASTDIPLVGQYVNVGPGIPVFQRPPHGPFVPTHSSGAATHRA